MPNAAPNAGAAGPVTFVVTSSMPGFVPPKIVIQYDPRLRTGIDWDVASGQPAVTSSEAGKLRDAVIYLQEAITRMTGVTLDIVNSNKIPTHLSKGIVLTTMKGASLDLSTDPQIAAALKIDPTAPKVDYRNQEAFYIRSESERLILIANSVDGLACAVPELLETVGYEVLGMGPNWTHVPHLTELKFTKELSGAPSFYTRYIAFSNQDSGLGVISDPVTPLKPPDELFQASFARWLIGTRTRWPYSLPWASHAFDDYHKRIVRYMLANDTADGFLSKATFGPDAKRPSAVDPRPWDLWINTDPVKPGRPGGRYFIYYAATEHQPEIWEPYSFVDGELPPGGEPVRTNEDGLAIDLSVEFVRDIILQDMLVKAKTHFTGEPESLFIFNTFPEDGGGYSRLEEIVKDKTWYRYKFPLDPESKYLLHNFRLHGFAPINQEHEQWELNASNTVFGFSNWLLRKFDESVTDPTWPDRTRCITSSYSYHDVPPTFNLDRRILVSIAGHGKHRGLGPWTMYMTHADVALAFKQLLPGVPLSGYRELSAESGTVDPIVKPIDSLVSNFSNAADRINHDFAVAYAAGLQALTFQTDFNFGKLGLLYYLYSKLLWNRELTEAEIDVIRNRWLVRAFGSDASSKMREYYDLMNPENYPVNSPQTWGTAIEIIDAADKILANSATEPEAQRRLDDLKQYWYYYFLIDANQVDPPTAYMRDFVWKGQMSYMTAMYAVISKYFPAVDGANPAVAAGPASEGPAHYTHPQTDDWWKPVMRHWMTRRVVEYRKDVDQNDLVAVEEFGTAPAEVFYYFNSTYFNYDFNRPRLMKIARKKNEIIGFKLFWWMFPGYPTSGARPVHYRVSRWVPADPPKGSWTVLEEKEKVPELVATRLTGSDGINLVDVKFVAKFPGTYKFDVGSGGDGAVLTGYYYDLATGKSTAHEPHTYRGIAGAADYPSAFFYIPKDTLEICLDVYGTNKQQHLLLYTQSSPRDNPRDVKLTNGQVQSYKLKAGEDGTIAELTTGSLQFPYLHSVPRLWAFSRSELLVPRAIAEADKLKII